MKRLIQTLVTLAVVLAPFAAAPIASAATCENGYTGPDSNNICTTTVVYKCTVINETTASIVNDNTQVALSGNASSGDNTSGGGAQTGTATNTNGVTFNVTVTNSTPEEKLCSVQASMPATPTPVTPATSVPVAAAGRGAIAAAPVTAPKATVAPRSLAQTSGDETAKYLVGSVAALAAAFGLSRAVVYAYGRYKA